MDSRYDPIRADDGIAASLPYSRDLSDGIEMILAEVEAGHTPCCITVSGVPDLVIMTWDDYWNRFGLLYEPGEREQLEKMILKSSRDADNQDSHRYE